ncbi:EAL domain-containing protein [Zooshikella harenae]|uniref:EAL domain-containing protein n=1 Tax=Zooshikella harenae TaxID=2827238 RepID=UPI002815DCB2|nr:transporter substrate-binding domain-containing protein [Zooshikella harenae]
MRQINQALLGLWLTIITLVCSGVAPAASTTESLAFNDEEKAWIDTHKVVSLAFDGYFPPFSFLSDNGKLEGFAVDVLNEIEKRIGVTFNISPQYEWKTLYQAAQKKQIDVVATMVDREERSKWFNFTDPYIYKSLVVISQAENQDIKKKEDVSGKRIALVKNYQYVDHVLQEFPQVSPVYVDTMLDALNAVSVGEADAAISFLSAVHYYRNKYLLSNLKYAAVYDKNHSNESIAVRKDWPELVSIINKGLHSIPESQMQKLRAKWLPVDYMENLVQIDFTEAEKKWLSQNRLIRLGIDPEFAPFEYIENGVYQGMASDYVKLLSQRLNLKMKIVDGLSWKEVIDKVKQGEIDVLPAVGVTEKRKRYLNYTKAYLSFHRVIVSRDDAPFIASLGDLYGQTVAVQINTSHHGFLIENTDINPVLYDTLQESLLAVSGGTVDAFVGNVASATYWIRKLNLTNLKISAPASTEVQTLHFAVRNDLPELASILQKGLNTIGPRKRKAISEKWLSIEYEPEVDYSLLWKVVAVFSGLVVSFLIWNILLNRKVRLRTSQLHYTANYDQLTDLPNRFLILDRLKQLILDARRNHRKVALFSIDIDDFKKINDGLGHKIGDAVLKECSTRLKGMLRENDTLGRLGGDQFLVIQTNFADASDSAHLAEKLLDSLNQNFKKASQEISIRASIGIALFPDDGTTAETLLTLADTATHHAKEEKQGHFAFYTEGLLQKVSRRLELEKQLRGALERNELQVYYQPKVDAKTNGIVSFEALIRWFNPEMGTVSPVEFIPIAEKASLIQEIGFFVITEAFEKLTQWQRKYSDELSMAINLSPVQFRSGEIVSALESLFLQYELNSRSVEFEITEGLLLSNYCNVEEELKKLESLGVTLTMDDFGTGYSSLSYLRQYKFDSLKIDREFIMDLEARESARKLVSATIAMAHELGMTVVAEGVETEEQKSILVASKCNFLQGWLFSKPLPAAEIDSLLEKESFK